MNLDRLSRRSSILKPSKDEDSPATMTTRNRRVSFAEKKHIKEFSHSVEQGTVWDNTYEESDSSQMRNSQSLQIDENSPRKEILKDSLPTASKPLADKTNYVAFNPQEATIIQNKSVKFTQEIEYRSINEIPNQVEPKLVDLGPRSERTMTSQSQAMDFTDVIERISALPRNVSDNNKCENLQSEPTTIFHDDSMDCTDEIFQTRSDISELGRVEYVREELDMNVPEKTTIFQDISMDLTEAVERISSLPRNPIDNSKIVDIQPERTTFFDNQTMEFTNIVRKPSNTEKIHDTETPRMELTESIERIPIVSKKISDNTTFFHLQPEKTTIFQDDSMEMTQIVRGPSDTREFQRLEYQRKNLDDMIQPEETTIFHDTSMELTEAVERIQALPRDSNVKAKIAQVQPERTTIFDNQTMEFTNIVRKTSDTQKIRPAQSPSMELTEAVERIQALPRDSNVKAKIAQIQPERTTIFDNQTMEFTNIVRKTSDTQKIRPAQSPSMELTEAVERIQALPRDSNIKAKIAQIQSERTTIFDNQTMEFTNIVRKTSDTQNQRLPAISRVSSDKATKIAHIQPERTTIFYNQTMEFTNIVRKPSDTEKMNYNQQSCQESPPMDLTEVVERIPAISRVPSDKAIKIAQIQPERTTIFDNQTMELTNIVRKPSDTEKMNYNQQSCQESPPMDLTEVIERIPATSKFPSDKVTKIAHIQPERTTIFDNQTMEFTNIVRKPSTTEKIHHLEAPSTKFTDTIQRIRALPKDSSDNAKDKHIQPERTEIFENEAMEFTNIIRKPSDTEKIHHLEAPSTKFTDTIQRIRALPKDSSDNAKIEHILSEATTTFENGAMEFTNIVRKPSNTEKIRHRESLSMDLTDAFKGILAPPRVPKDNVKDVHIQPEGTEIFENEAMEFTNIIRKPSGTEKIPKDNVKDAHIQPEGTEIFENEAMEFTNIIRKPSGTEKIPKDNVKDVHIQPEGTEIFENEAMEFTNIIQKPSGTEKIHHKESEPKNRHFSESDNRTTIFQNQPMDFAETFQRISVSSANSNEIAQSSNTTSAGKEFYSEFDANTSISHILREKRDERLPVKNRFDSNDKNDNQKSQDTAEVNVDMEMSAIIQNVLRTKGLERNVENLKTKSFHDESIKENVGNKRKNREIVFSDSAQDISGIVQFPLESAEHFIAHRDSVAFKIFRNNESDYRLREENKKVTGDIEISKKIEIAKEISLSIDSNEENREKTMINNSLKEFIDLETLEAPSFMFANSISTEESTENIESIHLSTVESNVGNCEKFATLRFDRDSKFDSKIRAKLGLSDIASDELVQAIMDTNALIKELNKSPAIKYPQSPPEQTETKIVTQPVELQDISVFKSSFCILKETIEALEPKRNSNTFGYYNTSRDDISVWSIDQLDKKALKFYFLSKSIRLTIYLNEKKEDGTDGIQKLVISSELDQDSKNRYKRMAHRLIMQKLDSDKLSHSYRSYDDIPKLLEYLSTEVTLGIDFMKELKYLDDRNIMEIYKDSIFIRVRTRDIDDGIIINVMITMKPFEEITPDDITISYLLGAQKIHESDIKKMIKNIKRDHRFLRTYVNDIKDYLDVMALTFKEL